MTEPLWFALQIDCESTQHAVRNPALGERAVRGLREVLAETNTRGTFFVIPGDLEAHAVLYRQLAAEGHEIGLHVHPREMGYGEFFGAESPDNQRRMLREAIDRFAQVMGERPRSFCPGYVSANDFTFGILEELGFTHGTVSMPTRVLPQCAAVWAGSPLDPRYPHRFNRLLPGDVNFVDLPPTVDPDSRMWGGGQPLDLRVELVDARNHWYTMDKAVRRQIAAHTPLLQLHALTHNVFEYDAPKNFRRETYLGIVHGARQIAERETREFRAATLAELASAFRERVPWEQATSPKLELDQRGQAFRST